MNAFSNGWSRHDLCSKSSQQIVVSEQMRFLLDCSGQHEYVVDSIPLVVLRLVAVHELPEKVQTDRGDRRGYCYARYPLFEKETKPCCQLLLSQLIEVRDAGKVKLVVVIVNELRYGNTAEFDIGGNVGSEIQNELIGSALANCCVAAGVKHWPNTRALHVRACGYATMTKPDRKDRIVVSLIMYPGLNKKELSCSDRRDANLFLWKGHGTLEVVGQYLSVGDHDASEIVKPNLMYPANPAG